MAILAQNKLGLKGVSQSQSYFHTPHAPILWAGRVHCAATPANPKTESTQLTLNLRAPRVTPSSILDDQSLASTWSHRAWVASGCATVLVSLAESVSGAADSQIWVGPALAGLVGYIVADLASGIYHWGIDNYGDATTPIFGPQIDAFQGHHRQPWIITRRQFSNNLHALGRAVTYTVLPLDICLHDPRAHAFVSVCAGCIMFSQQFHAWAHGTRSRLPPAVAALQDCGVLVSRVQHGAHHRPPYNSNYCIVSGAWNKFLDKFMVFQALEMIIFFRLGVRPRSWAEPGSEWIEESEM